MIQKNLQVNRTLCVLVAIILGITILLDIRGAYKHNSKHESCEKELSLGKNFEIAPDGNVDKI
jgi:hypothetical protein